MVTLKKQNALISATEINRLDVHITNDTTVERNIPAPLQSAPYPEYKTGHPPKITNYPGL